MTGIHRAILVLITITLSSWLSATCRADDCHTLSSRATHLNDAVGQWPYCRNASCAEDTGLSSGSQANLLCLLFKLNTAKAALYRTCYQGFGITALAAEEQARKFDSLAAENVGYCRR